MNLDKNNMRKIMMLIAFAVLLLMASSNVSTIWGGIKLIVRILTPFIFGSALAFVINVPMKNIEDTLFRKKKNKMARPISLILTLLFIIAVIALVFLVIIPQLGDTLVKLGDNIQRFWPKAQRWVIGFFRETPEIVEWIYSVEFDWEAILGQVIDFVKIGTGSILGSTVNVAKVIVSYAKNFFIGFVFAIYILLQKEVLKNQVKKILYAFFKPIKVKRIIDIARLTQKTFSNFISGQCLEAVILGTMFFIVLGILGFPYPLLIGVLIAFTAIIPVFGAFIGCAIGGFLILLENPLQALIFIGIFLLLQQIEGNLIYPHVVGNSVGLPSIWVLMAITLGGSLMGVLGMLIFIPIFSVCYALFREYVYKRLKDRKLLDKC